MEPHLKLLNLTFSLSPRTFMQKLTMARCQRVSLSRRELFQTTRPMMRWLKLVSIGKLPMIQAQLSTQLTRLMARSLPYSPRELEYSVPLTAILLLYSSTETQNQTSINFLDKVCPPNSFFHIYPFSNININNLIIKFSK